MVNLHSYDYANLFSVQTDENGFSYFNLMNSLIIDGDIDDTLYTEVFFNEEESWYGLSNRFYGTPRLWWIILVTNNIINPFEDKKTGDKIKVLKGEVVSEILSNINTYNG
jgi:hypothetical protein